MAHFAKLDSNNIVEQVIVVNNDDIKDMNTKLTMIFDKLEVLER